MGIEHTSDLLKFLQPFNDDKKELVLWLREFVWKLYPKTNELIYDNYNALAFGWSLTDKLGSVFCNIAIGRTNSRIQFGFFHGKHLADPEKRLKGQGNQYRYMHIDSKKDLPKTYTKDLLAEAYRNALSTVKDKSLAVQGTTITKSISEKKRTLSPGASVKKPAK